jgi:hypothetical protein
VATTVLSLCHVAVLERSSVVPFERVALAVNWALALASVKLVVPVTVTLVTVGTAGGVGVGVGAAATGVGAIGLLLPEQPALNARHSIKLSAVGRIALS